jgi:hypothetical protein
VLFAVFLAAMAFGEGMPSYYDYTLTPPAGVAALTNPSAVYYEHRHGEIYVTDTGNDRVVIFDKHGSYLFEFADHEHLGGPRSLAVDSTGKILVLCDRRPGRLEVFDYNGAFVREVNLTTIGTDSAIVLTSLVLDGADTLYAVSELPPRIYKFRTDGTRLGCYEIMEDLKPAERSQQILGSIALVGGMLIVPTPMFSQLEVHDTEGKLVKVFGQSGGGPGKLSFPIAATADGEGGTLVLDKHRHTLLQYRADGMFAQEIGGMGMAPGWFYHPTALATDDAGRCYVLQSFMSRIQAVKIPGVKTAGGTQVTVAKAADATAPAATQNK